MGAINNFILTSGGSNLKPNWIIALHHKEKPALESQRRPALQGPAVLDHDIVAACWPLAAEQLQERLSRDMRKPHGKGLNIHLIGPWRLGFL